MIGAVAVRSRRQGMAQPGLEAARYAVGVLDGQRHHARRLWRRRRLQRLAGSRLQRRHHGRVEADRRRRLCAAARRPDRGCRGRPAGVTADESSLELGGDGGALGRRCHADPGVGVGRVVGTAVGAVGQPAAALTVPAMHDWSSGRAQQRSPAGAEAPRGAPGAGRRQRSAAADRPYGRRPCGLPERRRRRCWRRSSAAISSRPRCGRQAPASAR